MYSPPKLNDRRILFGIFDRTLRTQSSKDSRLSDFSLISCHWVAPQINETPADVGRTLNDSRLMNILMETATQELLPLARASEIPNFWSLYPYSFTLSKTWTKIVVTLSINPSLSVFIWRFFFVIKFLLVMTQLWKLHSWTFYGLLHSCWICPD